MLHTLVSNWTVPLGRILFINKKGYTKEGIVVESSGPYTLSEKNHYFVIRNADRSKSIMVTVKAFKK